MDDVKKPVTKTGYISRNVYDGVRKMDAATAKRYVASMKKQIDAANRKPLTPKN